MEDLAEAGHIGRGRIRRCLEASVWRRKGVLHGRGCCRVWATAGCSSLLLVAAMVGLTAVVRLLLEAGQWRRLDGFVVCYWAVKGDKANSGVAVVFGHPGKRKVYVQGGWEAVGLWGKSRRGNQKALGVWQRGMVWWGAEGLYWWGGRARDSGLVLKGGGRPTFVYKEREACGRAWFSLVFAKREGRRPVLFCFLVEGLWAAGWVRGEKELWFLGFFMVFLYFAKLPPLFICVEGYYL